MRAALHCQTMNVSQCQYIKRKQKNVATVRHQFGHLNTSKCCGFVAGLISLLCGLAVQLVANFLRTFNL